MATTKAIAVKTVSGCTDDGGATEVVVAFGLTVLISPVVNRRAERRNPCKTKAAMNRGSRTEPKRRASLLRVDAGLCAR
jgi:hypothetical protein